MNIFVLIITTIYSVILFIGVGDKFDNTYLSHIIIIAGILLINQYIYDVKYLKIHPIASLDFVFILGFYVVNFSIPFLILSGEINYQGIDWAYPASSKFIKSNIISCFSIVSFSLAYILLMNYLRKIKNNHQKIRINQNQNYNKIALLLSIFGGFLIAYFIIGAGKVYLSNNYSGVKNINESYNVSLHVGQILLTLSASIIVYNEKNIRKLISIKFLVLLMPYYLLLFLYLLHGDRGGLFQSLSPVLFVIAYKTPKNIRLISLVFMLCISIIMLSVLRTARNESERSLDTILETTKNAKIENEIKTGASNIGGSGLLLPVAIKYVEIHGEMGGVFTSNSLLGIIPYLRRILKNYGFRDDLEHSQSADLLTELINGAGANSGVGTSSMAEFYLDFGLFGPIVGHFVIGLIAAFIQYKGIVQKKYPYLFIYIFSIGIFSTMARYSAITYLIKYIFYAVLALYVLGFFIKKSKV